MDEASDGKRLGEAIRALRKGRGERLRQLAQRAGVSPAWLSRLEHGEIPDPGESTVDAVAQALNFRDGNDVLRQFYGHDRYARTRRKMRYRPGRRAQNHDANGPDDDPPQVPPPEDEPPKVPKGPKLPEIAVSVVALVQGAHVLEALGLLGALYGVRCLRCLDQLDVANALTVLDVLLRAYGSSA